MAILDSFSTKSSQDSWRWHLKYLYTIFFSLEILFFFWHKAEKKKFLGSKLHFPQFFECWKLHNFPANSQISHQMSIFLGKEPLYFHFFPPTLFGLTVHICSLLASLENNKQMGVGEEREREKKSNFRIFFWWSSFIVLKKGSFDV